MAKSEAHVVYKSGAYNNSLIVKHATFICVFAMDENFATHYSNIEGLAFFEKWPWVIMQYLKVRGSSFLPQKSITYSYKFIPYQNV